MAIIRVTATVDLDDKLWGADQAYTDGGAQWVIDLVNEDPQEFLSKAVWVVERVIP
jgi:hypothetical protein